MIINVMSYLESSCINYPERTAVADCNHSLNYRQLMDTVSSAGSAIHFRLAKKANKPIAVCIKHNVNDIIAFFSIIHSGNFYVPIDMSLPRERVNKIINTVKPSAIITQDLENGTFDGIPTWTVDGLLSDSAQSVSPWKECKDTDLLYVIFTSGSTGDPKGVAISHRSVIDMAEQFIAVFGFEPGTVFGNQAPFDFDVSVKDIFISAKVGGTLEILEKKLFAFPKLLIERMNERKVDTIIWAVPALNIISKLKAFRTMKPTHLKNVMFSGEIMPLKTLQFWMDELPDVRFVNLYGPTEITCNCTYHIITDSRMTESAVPIGKAFPNCSVFLLSDGEYITEDNRIGEICVSGTCLAMGYYNRPDLTSEAFPMNPQNQAFPERIYKTGDLGCYRNGQLFFMGRKDTQIKHMGHRIELTEIILCTNSMDTVTASACVYDEDASRIILFYQGSADKSALSAYLSEKLPRYMLPAIINQIESFPKTRTGKIDNKELLRIAKGE